MADWFGRISNDPRIRAAREAVAALPAPVRNVARAGAIGAGVGVAVFATPPLLGFTSAGVAAGSIAATIQSVVYGAAVPAGSAFAILQSIGATGTVVPAVVAAVSAGGTAAAVGTAAEGNGGGEGGGEERREDEPEEGEGSDNGSARGGSEDGSKKAEIGNNSEVGGENSAEGLPPYDAVPIPVASLDEDQAPMGNTTLNVGRGGELGIIRPNNNSH